MSSEVIGGSAHRSRRSRPLLSEVESIGDIEALHRGATARGAGAGSWPPLRTARTTGLSSECARAECARANGTREIRAAPAHALPNNGSASARRLVVGQTCVARLLDRPPPADLKRGVRAALRTLSVNPHEGVPLLRKLRGEVAVSRQTLPGRVRGRRQGASAPRRSRRPVTSHLRAVGRPPPFAFRGSLTRHQRRPHRAERGPGSEGAWGSSVVGPPCSKVSCAS
jgi:hypothetical protein